jgi:hypothetical protein
LDLRGRVEQLRSDSTAQLADADDLPACKRSSTASSKPRTGKKSAIDDEHRAFFAEGDDGRYEGGPASWKSSHVPNHDRSWPKPSKLLLQ